jgi:hypothetical protein
VTTPVSLLYDAINPVSSSFHLIEVERIETYSPTCQSKPASIVKVVLPGKIVLRRRDLVTFLGLPKIEMIAVLANTLFPDSIALSYTIYSSFFMPYKVIVAFPRYGLVSLPIMSSPILTKR